MSHLLRVVKRIRELGVIGERLYAQLLPEDKKDGERFKGNEADEFYYISLLVKQNKLRAAAYSVLIADFAIQVPISKYDILTIVPYLEIVLEVKNAHLRSRYYDGTKNRWCLPLKSHPGAMNKVNVYFSEIMGELKRLEPQIWRQVMKEQWRLGGLYDDQASALIMYTSALSGEFGSKALDIATSLVHRPIVAKGLSTVLKSLGVNGTRFGSILCEANTLQGRGVGVINFEDEVSYRLNPDLVAEKVIDLDASSLRKVVRSVIRRELMDGIVFEDLPTYWSKRWSWCVNGAHGNSLGRIDKRYQTNFRKRMHRRVFAENIEKEPISGWSGDTYFTLSEKLEHGKTRAIFGGDSVSYFCFDHLLRSIEQNWRGERVILDPGSGGSCGMADRVESLGGAWNVMMDYDDFNSQHSLQSQKIVIDELVHLSGYDYVLGYKLVSSFDKQFVMVDGKPVKSFGTLMSGHRATTIINSVLNLAYVQCAYPAIERCSSLHVGDDIIIKTDVASEAVDILTAVMSSGVRMNPLKQSVGTYSAEFLRHASGKEGSYGYVCRSISSVVSGNWESDNRLDSEEFINSVLQSSWTMMNRSGTNCAVLMAQSFNRVSGIKIGVCRGALLGRVSVNGSPVRAQNWSVKVVNVKNIEVSDNRQNFVEESRRLGGRAYATSDYQREHLAPVEVLAVSECGVDLNRIMVESSYKKTLLSDNIGIPLKRTVKYERDRWRPVSGFSFSEIKSKKTHKGVLTRYPILHLVRNRMSESLVRRLLIVTGNTDTGDMDIMTYAFGDQGRHRVWVVGAVPYSDVRSLVLEDETQIYSIRQRYF